MAFTQEAVDYVIFKVVVENSAFNQHHQIITIHYGSENITRVTFPSLLDLCDWYGQAQLCSYNTM